MYLCNCVTVDKFVVQNRGNEPMRIITKQEKEKVLKQFCKEVGINYCFATVLKNHAFEEKKYLHNPVQSEKIVFTGDSRTACADLQNNIHIGLEVENSGISGSTISDWSSDFGIQFIIMKNPKKFCISAGGNDLGAGGSKHPIQKIVGDLFEVLWTMQMYTDSKLYCCCVLPIIKHGSATNKEVCELNKWIKIACKLLNVSCIDFYNDFLDPKTGWCNIKYLRPEEYGSATKYLVLLEALKSNDMSIVIKARNILRDGMTVKNPQTGKKEFDYLWSRQGPVHFSPEGNNKWFCLLNSFLNSN